MHNHRWLHTFFGLILGVFLGAIFTADAVAQSNSGSLVQTGAYGGSPYPGGLNAASDYRHIPAGGPSANDPSYRRAYGIPNGSLGRHAKGLLRGGLGNAALLAALAAIGWGMDSILDDLYGPAQPYVLNPNPWYILKASMPGGQGNLGRFVANTPAEVCPLITHGGGGWTWTGSPARCRHGSIAGSFIPVQDPQQYTETPNDTKPQGVPQVVPDNQLGEYLAGQPQTHQGLLNNAQGVPYATQEAVNAQNQLAAELNAAYGANLANQALPNPNAIPSTNPNPYPNSQTPNPNNNTQPTALEFPVFCTWASKVCELADWFREDPDADPDVELPEVALPTTAPAFTSSIGAGSCPASPQVAVLGTTVEFSYTPLCTFAGYMYYVSLAIAALISAYIVTGKKRA